MKKLFLALLLLSSTIASAQVHKGLSSKELQSVERKISAVLTKTPIMFRTWRTQSERVVRLERVDCSEGRVNLYFNEGIIQIPIREELCAQWEQMVRDTLCCYLNNNYSDAKVGIFYKSTPIERYIPNFYRNEIPKDINRKSKPVVKGQLVKPIVEPTFGNGLSNRHIALWPSHGYYMDFEDSLWKFQRPALFGTIEDLHTYFYNDRYLIPMLENAGATVITPRERDTNTREIILDNDRSTSSTAKITYPKNWTSNPLGYKHIDTLFTQNPFQNGTYLQSPPTGGTITYSTTIETPGTYAVYVSYKPLPENDSRARYTIHHASGQTTFEVNQRMGGGWLYLGKFSFSTQAIISLTSSSQITSDAIKIGGGMGSIKRLNSTSDVPRWAEAARYFMQYSGVPASIYCQDEDNKKVSDYMDDYKSRGDWVNYLKSQQNIPIDLAITTHTNSGIVDSTFGTLAICYTKQGKATYNDGTSKFAARDFADILQTQIVADIRNLYDTSWTRRSLYDKQYAEISRPDVPSAIIEMFSHQNFNDMRLALTPTFRFDICRAIYKGVLKFLADRYDLPYTVQPLPPSNFFIDIRQNKLSLRWSATLDPLESTATTDYYRLDTITLQIPQYDTPIICDGKIRSFAITAYNDGGKSFSSDTLRSCFFDNAPTALIIKDIPQLTSIDTLHSSSGRGIVLSPESTLYDDYSIVGKQIDFDPRSQFIDNDNPGWGASSRELIFQGVKNHLNNTLHVLYEALQQSKTNFIETNHATLSQMEYIPTTVYVVSTLTQSEIEAKYSALFPQTTQINYICATE